MASDAFVVGEDWISEHYFNTESTKQSFHARLLSLRKDWDARAKEGETTPSSRLAEVRREVQTALAREVVDARAYKDDVLSPLVRALGYTDARWHRIDAGPATLMAATEAPEAVLGAVVRARRVDDVSDLLAKDDPTLIEPFVAENGDEVRSVARTLSYLFSGDDAPAFAVVIAGTWALLAERDRWPEGRYLAVDLQLVLDRNDTKRAGEFDRAVSILAAETVLPDAGGATWWADTLEDSVKHTVGVSKDLREGVRESIEIVANEVVRRRAQQGLEALPDEQAQVLARQSLRYLYRILFLLYAEASPELKVLPVGVPEYSLGYGLDRLRELVLVVLRAESRDRTHLYASLETLTRLVDAGHNDRVQSDEDKTLLEGLVFNPLNADLFSRDATGLIDEVKLGDGALQRVLQLLLLTRESQTKRGRDRGFISYADLGINQLGAVYEGLMSYTGFFAAEDLYEVAPGGDGSKGSWVVPVTRADGIASTDFVRITDRDTGETPPRRYSGGEFVFRLSGRERQTSASYYSPEVLTKFVVSQALEELLDQDGSVTSAEEILSLSVCEPALGSGAFAIEAVRQLAEQYLDRRERETNDKIDPDERPRELQKAKAAIALHQVYGVDLNATAVELAEISLWLDTMVDGLQAPWFGLRLRRGNSLIGARRAVYSEKQVTSKAWLKDVPTDVPVSNLVEDMLDGRVASVTSGKIHHFLLPAEGWGAAVDAKEGKELAPEAFVALREWRKKMRQKPSKDQLKKLQGLAHRVEVLWQFTLRRLEIAETQVRRDVSLWNDPRPENDGVDAVTRADIEAFLNDPNGAYQRLRRVMDAWCAMWFWPLTDAVTDGAQPPSLDEWIDGLSALLGHHFEVNAKRAAQGAQTLGLPTGWHDLDRAEEVELGFAQVTSVDYALEVHPWLRAASNIAKVNGFFHWELDFAGVFARGGFDLQVGNPPWVRPEVDSADVLAEYDVWFVLNRNASVSEVRERRGEVLSSSKTSSSYLAEIVTVVATRTLLSSHNLYPVLQGLRADLYRCFMVTTWRNRAERGIVGLIHPESHFSEDKAGVLRAATYLRLRQHWHFLNEKLLFDIGNKHVFGVHVYGSPRDAVQFTMASYIYHPDVVTGSLRHNGEGRQPGLKDDDGTWDMRVHASRVTKVSDETLQLWHALLGPSGVPVRQARMLYVVNESTSTVLEKIGRAPRLGEKSLNFSQGWNETTDREKGLIVRRWGASASWDDVIIQGPNLFANNPFYKRPNREMKSNKDWTLVDLEALDCEAIPVTAYKRLEDRHLYDKAYTRWGSSSRSARDFYRIAWRGMAKTQNERTLMPVIIPPGTAHVHAVQSAGGVGNLDLVLAAASLGSIIADLGVRTAAPSTLSIAVLENAPIIDSEWVLSDYVARRYLRLVSVVSAYSDLYESVILDVSGLDDWVGGIQYRDRPEASIVDGKWSGDVALRRDSDRRQAQIEIDTLFALFLGITADELCTIYRTQFAVLYGYDRNSYFYDANGRLVPQDVLKVWRKKGDAITQEERTAVHPGSGVAYEYELPFVTLDREADMRQAYAHFEKILEERS